MSCIKFPSSKSELAKAGSSSNASDYMVLNSQLILSADEAFGKNLWSHSITSQTLDFIDSASGSYRAGCACTVRITIKNGTFHEGIGYTCAEGSSKGSAIQKTRLGSYYDALKKTLVYFGVNATNKIDASSTSINDAQSVNSTNNTPKKESASKVVSNFNSISNGTERTQIIVPTSNKTFVKKESVSSTAKQIEFEPFESIPLSQTDAFIDSVDIDQLFSKEKISEVKTNTSKPTTSTVDKILTPDKTNGLNLNNNEIKVENPSVSTAKDRKIDSNSKEVYNSSSNSRVVKDNTSSQKPLIYTVPTEEEARLERKRKQKEKQEEFKRKQEIKRSCSSSLSKPTPNPRY